MKNSSLGTDFYSVAKKFLFSFFFLFLLGASIFATFVLPARGDAMQQVEGVGLDSPEQFYNQALELEGKGEKLPALIALRRALVLDPHLKEARHEAKSLLDQLGIGNPPTWRERFAMHFSSTLLLLVGMIAGWLGACSFLYFLFVGGKRFSQVLRRRRFILMSSLLIFVIGHIMAYVGLETDPRWYDRNAYILLSSSDDFSHQEEGQQEELGKVGLLDAPLDQATVIAQVPVGTLLQLRAQRGTWSYVMLESGVRGWIPSPHLEKLIP